MRHGNRPLMSRLLQLFIVGALALCAGGLRAQDAAAVLGTPARWLDDRGQAFELKTLQGRWTVMTMAYGACRRICSTSLRVLEQAQALADAQQHSLNFVVIGLDPAQDKPADWAQLRHERRLHRTNWHFLSADAEATRVMAQRLGVRYWRYGDHTMHDFRIVLLNPQGRLVRSLDSFSDPVQRLLP
jgi:cytochrome oxidase Cu insertion factor (SCO1/SenC/PrrC family)